MWQGQKIVGAMYIKSLACEVLVYWHLGTVHILGGARLAYTLSLAERNVWDNHPGNTTKRQSAPINSGDHEDTHLQTTIGSA